MCEIRCIPYGLSHTCPPAEGIRALSSLNSRILGVPLSTFWSFLLGSPRGLPDCTFKAVPAYAAALSRAEPSGSSGQHARQHASEPGLDALPRGIKVLKRHPEVSNGLFGAHHQLWLFIQRACFLPVHPPGFPKIPAVDARLEWRWG